MSFKYPTLLLLLTLVLAGCESEVYIYESPALVSQYISYTIDGQDQLLNAVSNSRQSAVFSTSDNSGDLYVQRLSTDNRFEVIIEAFGLPIQEKATGTEYDAEGSWPATVSVRSASMGGTVYCPHDAEITSVVFPVRLKFSSLDLTGRMRGTFEAEEINEGNVTLTNGVFDIVVTKE